jgi:hypothetical protein
MEHSCQFFLQITMNFFFNNPRKNYANLPIFFTPQNNQSQPIYCQENNPLFRGACAEILGGE